MSALTEEVRTWIKKKCFNADHMMRAAYWVRKLDPKADEALIIAALAHDAERAFEKNRKPPKDEETVDWDDVEYSLWHGKRSAEIVSEFLRNKGASEELIREVGRLVSVHELGGDRSSDLLKDADSISFLEVVAPQFISWVPKRYSAKDVKKKLDWMFGRITDPKAHRLAKPFYHKAIKKLSAQPG
jgi:hypothetical protein